MAEFDVEGIERATMSGVAPDEVHEVAGFLVGVDAGTLDRARSAVPLRHDGSVASATLDQIEALYGSRGRSPLFRVPDVPAQSHLETSLSGRGYASDTPTLVKIGAVSDMLALAGEPAGIASRPDLAWSELFLGEGFDPVDGASRIRNLGRTPGAVFASVREGSAAIAVGVGAFGHGWLSVHGMRTHPGHRGRGLAGRVLAALAAEAHARGLAKAFLQVMEKNAPARRLYGKAGFTPAWTYRYWRR